MSDPKFKIGDKVLYTNDYGVEWGERTITAIHDGSGFTSPTHRYFIEPTDTPWFPISEENLARSPEPVQQPLFDTSITEDTKSRLKAIDDGQKAAAASVAVNLPLFSEAAE